MSKNNRSGGREGFYHSKTYSWIATLVFKGQYYFLGKDKIIKEAAKARLEARDKIVKPILEKNGALLKLKKKLLRLNTSDFVNLKIFTEEVCILSDYHEMYLELASAQSNAIEALMDATLKLMAAMQKAEQILLDTGECKHKALSFPSTEDKQSSSSSCSSNAKAEIFRPCGGVYRSITNLDNRQAYILESDSNGFPILKPVKLASMYGEDQNNQYKNCEELSGKDNN